MIVFVECGEQTFTPCQTFCREWGTFYVINVGSGYVWVTIHQEGRNLRVHVNDTVPHIPKKVFVENIEVKEKDQLIPILKKPKPRPLPPIELTDITFASTWNVQCGIATYTKYLTDVLKCLNPELTISTSLQPIKPATLLHVQHEFGIYPDLSWLNFEASRKVVTWHTVIKTPSYYQRADMEVDAHITHLPTMCAALRKWTTKPLYCIPHGSLIFTPVERDKARQRLKLPTDTEIGFIFGFRSAVKGYMETLQALKQVTRTHPHFLLIITASPHQSGRWNDYVELCREESAQMGLLDNTLFLNRFLTEEEVNLYLSAADLLIFNYVGSDSGSTSGALHRVLAAAKPIAASNHPLLSELTHNVNALIHDKNNPKQLAQNIIAILEDRRLAEKLGEGARKLAEETSWQNVALKHLEVYKKVCET